MTKYLWVAFIYFGYELMVNGLIPTFLTPTTNQDDPYSSIVQQFFDMVIIASLLIIVRPREWPEFYEVAMLEDMGYLEEM